MVWKVSQKRNEYFDDGREKCSNVFFFVHCTIPRAKTFQRTSGFHGILLRTTLKISQRTCRMEKSSALAICFLGYTKEHDRSRPTSPQPLNHVFPKLKKDEQVLLYSFVIVIVSCQYVYYVTPFKQS